MPPRDFTVRARESQTLSALPVCPQAEPVALPSSAESAEAHPPTPKAPADTLFAFIHVQLVGVKPAAAQSPWLSAKAGKSCLAMIWFFPANTNHTVAKKAARQRR
jgi:hypothetical protein